MSTFLTFAPTRSSGADISTDAASPGGSASYLAGSGNILESGPAGHIYNTGPDSRAVFSAAVPGSTDYTFSGVAADLTATGSAGLIVDSDSSQQNQVVLLFTDSSDWQFFRTVGGSTSGVGGPVTLAFTDGDTFSVQASGSNLIFQHNGSAIATIARTRMPSDTSTCLCGIYMAGNLSGSVGIGWKSLSGTFSPVLTQNGNMIVTSPNLNAITIAAPTIGGIGVLTYSWHKSTIPNATPGSGNLLSDGGGISGSSTAVLTDASTLNPGVTYYYICIVSDGVTTIQFPNRPVKAAASSIKVVIIGDSQSVDQAQCNNLGSSTQELALLQSEFGIMGVTMQNGAVPGTATSDWISTAGGSHFANLLAACGGSFNGYDVDIRIGVNDAQASVSSATYLANLSTIIANAQAAGALRIWLHMPLPRESGLFGENGVTVFTDAIWPFLVAYKAALMGLIGGNVHVGDFTSYEVFSENPELYFNYSPGTRLRTPGAIHPTQEGAHVMAAAQAKAKFTALYPAPAPGPLPSIGSSLIGGR